MWCFVVILLLAIAGSTFSANPPDGEREAYDVKQYEFAKAASRIGTSRDFPPRGIVHQVYNDGMGVNTVTFREMSQATIVKICMDLDVKIMVKNENKLIDCRAVRQFFIPAVPYYESDNFLSDRLKRDETNDNEGSGENPFEDSIFSSNTSSTNETATTVQKQLNTTQQERENATSKVTGNKNTTNTMIDDKTKTAQTNVIGQANEKDKNITSLTGTPQNITNQNNTSTFNSTQLLNNHTANAQISNGTATVTNHLTTNPNVTLQTSVNATGKEVPDTHANHTKANVTETKESRNDVTGINIKEGPIQNKTEIHRKGKHMDLDSLIPEVHNVNSTTNLTREVGGNDKMNLRGGIPTNSTQTGTPKTDSSTKQSTGGSTIIWFLFGGVVIAGAVLVGYKYMKKRNARQAEPIPKRNIANPVASAHSNGPREQEMRPLISDVNKSNNVKANAGDTDRTSETRDHEQNRSEENGTGDHLSKVETTNETTNRSPQNPEE